jgi:GrpB-like predicted nucleotidyltransferase (UPF0157 family)
MDRKRRVVASWEQEFKRITASPMASASYRIAEYDKDWPAQFEQEKARVVSALGIDEGCVVHVGSTSVPGLAAKPIIDMMVGIPAVEEAGRRVTLLEDIGYEHRGETVPGTLYIRKETPRRYNLHLTEHRGVFWEDHLLFRDHLRAHSDSRERYETLKRELMSRLAADPPAYNDGKSDFIRATMADARRELESSP